MIWSKYNYIFNTQHGDFLYNSFTNNLMQVSPDFLEIVDLCKTGKYSQVSTDVIESLNKHHILVDDDLDLYEQIKAERLASRYNTKYLSLTIAPTTGCNFKCSYCYEAGVTANIVKDKTVSIEDIVAFVDSFKSIDFLRVTWYGGEPLLMSDYIESLSNKFKEMFADYNAYMITNGYLLDKSKAAKLKALNIKGLQITVDGLEATHNKRRPHKTNADSFQRIISNLDNLFNVYPEVLVSLRINVDKTNEYEYHKLYQFLKTKFGKYNVNIHPGYVTDEFSSEPNRCCFLYDEINDFVIRQYDDYSIPISLYPSSSFGECCARHMTSFVIGPRGELYKCWNDIGIVNREVGNVKDFSLSNKKAVRYLLTNDPLENENCKDCFCFPICNGGCPYNRIYHSDKQNKFCEAKKESIKAFLPRYVDYKINKI